MRRLTELDLAMHMSLLAAIEGRMIGTIDGIEVSGAVPPRITDSLTAIANDIQKEVERVVGWITEGATNDREERLADALIGLMNGTKMALCESYDSHDCETVCPLNVGDGECAWTEAFEICKEFGIEDRLRDDDD